MALHSKKVFITGIEGFTGKHLEKHLLEQGYEVFGTVFGKSNLKNHFQCDIRDKEQLKSVLREINPDFIFHLAAISFVADDDFEKMFAINVNGTLNLLDAIIDLKLSVSKIIIVSSANVYGNQSANVLNETMSPHPINHYGSGKLYMENMVKTYFDKLNILITRPFNYTGIGQNQNFLIPKIISHYKAKKEEIELGNLQVKREFNDVRDVVEIYYGLMNSPYKSEIINICSGKSISLFEIISIMNQLAGYEIKVTVNPKFIRKNEIEILSGSTGKLLSLVDKKAFYSIEETLKEMYEG